MVDPAALDTSLQADYQFSGGTTKAQGAGQYKRVNKNVNGAVTTRQGQRCAVTMNYALSATVSTSQAHSAAAAMMLSQLDGSAIVLSRQAQRVGVGAQVSMDTTVEASQAQSLRSVALLNSMSVATSQGQRSQAVVTFPAVTVTSKQAQRSTAVGAGSSGSTVSPVIATQSQWDAHFFGGTVPALNNASDTLAWETYYWLRSYVSMMRTYGDTKYADRAVTTINYMLSVENAANTWGLNNQQYQLHTAQVTQAIMCFVYAVYKDSRFTAYRATADTYMARCLTALQGYDSHWADNTPVYHQSFYYYWTCGSGTDPGNPCSTDSYLMYNQGASMCRAGLLIDQVYRMKGLTPPAGFMDKAIKAVAYFHSFVQTVSGRYLWRYTGVFPDTTSEDTAHGHVDIGFLYAALKCGVTGMSTADMTALVNTFNLVMNGAPGVGDVAYFIDGTGNPTSNYDRVSVGYDWIDLADYGSGVLDKVITVFNNYLGNFNVARGALGWAEIQRKNAGVQFY